MSVWRWSSGSRCSPPSAPTTPTSLGSAELVEALEGALEDFAAYRALDVRWHVTLAEAAASPRLLQSMTDTQGRMTELISHIAHPPEVLAWSNAQHGRVLAALRERDEARAARELTEHLRGTEHVLAGLLPKRA